MTFKFAIPPESSHGSSHTSHNAALTDALVQHETGGATAERLPRVVLVGNPNVGKSVIFGALTGTYVTVSNYPGTTVEVTHGRASFVRPDTDDAPTDDPELVCEVLDTPGTNNLVPMSEDEAVTRDILLEENHDALVQVGDAKNLARTLLLTLQLAELGMPFVLDLNMADEAKARGIKIDLEALGRALQGVAVQTTTATEGEGLAVLKAEVALAAAQASRERGGGPRVPLACAPLFPEDVERAIEELLPLLPDFPVAKRGVATMVLAGERGLSGRLGERIAEPVRSRAKVLGEGLRRTHGVPVFALLAKLRLRHAQDIVRRVQTRTDVGTTRSGQASFRAAVGLGGVSALVAGLAYDSALARVEHGFYGDVLDDFGALSIAMRAASRDLLRGWHASSLVLAGLTFAVAAVLTRRHAHARGAAWKIAAAIAVGYGAFWLSWTPLIVLTERPASWPLMLGAFVGLAVAGGFAVRGDRRDPATSQSLGRLTTHPRLGVPLLFVVLFYSYKIVGVFGAGTAVDALENGLFGASVADVALGSAGTDAALLATDDALDGTMRLVAIAEPGAVQVVAETKAGAVYVVDPTARIDIHAPRGTELTVSPDVPGALRVQGAGLASAEARIWKGVLNRHAYRFFAWLGIPLLTAFVVGKYGLLTMGVTYAVAIVLPVVATFFFVFSMMEDSGYLPRLAVMANRGLTGIGLNGRAVLPMVLGLGCDTMATLTARIMETKKERVLVTLLLALAIPCSSQLSVVFALMQRTGAAASIAWLLVVLSTLVFVGWAAARLVPGDRSDFLLELPPLRRPALGNLVSKTMARIEWYLKEAVPLFLAGTVLLFVLDRLSLLRFVHAVGEPIVHHVLGFQREGGIADRVSEALLVGFLRRDFGAAGLLDLAHAGRLGAADIAVSMVTITLFIPCIANVFMIVKERGWKVAGAMCGFVFPYAIAVGALVRFAFHFLRVSS